MSAIPSDLGRAPNLLFAQLSLAKITRTNLALFRAHSQLATGRLIERPSDDAVRAGMIGFLDDRLDRTAQRLRNLDHAEANLNLIDAVMGEVSDALLEAKSIATAQAGTGASADERAAQATIVHSLIAGLFNLVNRQGAGGYLFGGSRTSLAPVEEFLGSFRYRGQGPGLVTDLDAGSAVPITLGGDHALGGTSARVRGTVDLDPDLTLQTRLADLAGARGLGVTPGPVRFSFNSGPIETVDLTGADTVGDIVRRLTAALRQYETAHGVTILGPGGVSILGEAITFDIADPDGTDPALEFFDIGAGVTGKDLGLVSEPASAFTPSAGTGADLRPRLTWLTPVSALAGLTGPLGSITVSNAGQTRTVDLSTAQTLQDIRNRIEGAGLGVRVQINAAGTGLDVVSELATPAGLGLSIAEVPGSNLTATRLGIRSLAEDTRLEDFNDGRGVQIVTGSSDPVTGQPDPSRDVDFVITLGDGREIEVDLRPEDVVTVRGVLDRINSLAAARGLAVPGQFLAALSEGANGLTIRQDPASPGPITISPRNNSPAAEQLGLLDGAYDPGSATLTGTDRAKVRVQNVFSHLMDLRDALARDDTAGITLAGEGLERSIARVALERGTVGAHARRVVQARARTEDLAVFDEQVRSQLRDVDYVAAASRLSLLQAQLAAGLQSAAMISRRSLLDFLG